MPMEQTIRLNILLWLEAVLEVWVSRTVRQAVEREVIDLLFLANLLAVALRQNLHLRWFLPLLTP